MKQTSLHGFIRGVPAPARASSTSRQSTLDSHLRPSQQKAPSQSARRTQLAQIAQDTLATLAAGHYTLSDGTSIHFADDLESMTNATVFYSPAEDLAPSTSTHPTRIRVQEMTTIEGMRFLHSESSAPTIGVLNFASAHKPGGGFLTGAQAQEESIARSSTLYYSLMSPTGQRFYKTHGNKNLSPDTYYTHSIIWSPNVVLIKNDSGALLNDIVKADMVTCAAVNAGVVIGKCAKDDKRDVGAEKLKIQQVMRQRMSRILAVFVKHNVQRLVLGSFGTGVFKNDVTTVARIWKDLLHTDYHGAFTDVLFAIYGADTFKTFQSVFGT